MARRGQPVAARRVWAWVSGRKSRRQWRRAKLARCRSTNANAVGARQWGRELDVGLQVRESIRKHYCQWCHRSGGHNRHRGDEHGCCDRNVHWANRRRRRFWDHFLSDRYRTMNDWRTLRHDFAHDVGVGWKAWQVFAGHWGLAACAAKKFVSAMRRDCSRLAHSSRGAWSSAVSIDGRRPACSSATKRTGDAGRGARRQYRAIRHDSFSPIAGDEPMVQGFQMLTADH